MSAAPQSAPDAGPSRAARAGVLMALSTLAMAGGSAIQAVLYLGEYGATARTDAFFAAFAIYQVTGVFTQATRVSAVPLLAGDRAIGMLRYFGGLALIAIPIVIACGPLAGPLANLLAPAATGSAHDLAIGALRVLGVAMVLQLIAAGAATLLAMRDRFEAIAGAYSAGALAGLLVFIAVRQSGELALAWSMMAMGVVTFVWSMIALAGVRRQEVAAGTGGPGLPGVGSPARLLKLAAHTAVDLLGRSVVYFVINAFFLVTLAIVGREGGAGATTVLSYAYLLASYLVAGTSTAVGISRAPDMVRGVQEAEWTTVVGDTVPHGYRYAVLVCAPVLAAGVVAAAPVVGTLLPDALGAGQPEMLARAILLLAPWTAGALLLNFAIPALFALGRARAVNLLAPCALALHIIVSMVAATLGGVDAVIAAMAIAPLLFVGVLLAIGARRRLGGLLAEVARDTGRLGFLAAAAFAAGTGLAAVSGSEELAGAAVALVTGGVLYGAGLMVLMPRAVAVLAGAGRGRGGASADA